MEARLLHVLNTELLQIAREAAGCEVITTQGGESDYLCLRILRNVAQYNASTKGLGVWGRNNQVPRGACFKAALDTLFGGDCPAHCSSTRERFQSCDRCPKISNSQLIAAFRDMEMPDEAQLETQALPVALPEHAIATQAVPTEAGGTGTN